MSAPLYVARMRIEWAELNDRIKLLSSFLFSEKFAELDDTDKLLLRHQFNIMNMYQSTLSHRLERVDQGIFVGGSNDKGDTHAS